GAEHCIVHRRAGGLGAGPAARAARLDLRPEGRPDHRSAGLPLRMMETYRGAVYPWHCDQMGHMNVMWYVGKFDEATWNLFAAIGVTTAFLKEKRRGVAAVQQNITYKRELLAGDTIAVRSAFLEVRD